MSLNLFPWTCVFSGICAKPSDADVAKMHDEVAHNVSTS